MFVVCCSSVCYHVLFVCVAFVCCVLGVGSCCVVCCHVACVCLLLLFLMCWLICVVYYMLLFVVDCC